MLPLPLPSRCDPGEKTKGPKEGKKQKPEESLALLSHQSNCISNKTVEKDRLRIH
jgi:hypothetical protein